MRSEAVEKKEIGLGGHKEKALLFLLIYLLNTLYYYVSGDEYS